jgi:scavenger receptor class B protein 1
MTSENKIKCCKVFFCIGVLIITSAIGSYFNVNYIIKNQIYQNLVLTENSTAFKFWTNPPATVYRKYYFFNVVNAKEVLKGKKPNLVQCGPYIYREVLEKKNIVFNGKNYVSFNPIVTLYFEPDLSNGTENDIITFLNVPAVVIFTFYFS